MHVAIEFDTSRVSYNHICNASKMRPNTVYSSLYMRCNVCIYVYIHMYRYVWPDPCMTFIILLVYYHMTFIMLR